MGEALPPPEASRQSQINGSNPSGDGSLQLKVPEGTPLGIGNARGFPLFDLNARVTKNFCFRTNQKLGVFIEMYNLPNRANFGNSVGSNAASPANYRSSTNRSPWISRRDSTRRCHRRRARSSC
jgi:hypothetical protein